MTGSGALGWIPRSLFAADPLDGTEDGQARRTVRDWMFDAVLFCGAAFAGLVASGVAREFDRLPAWALAIDLPLGASACLLLWWRRRFPLAVAVLAAPALVLSNSAFGAGIVITLNLALRVPWRRALPLLGVYVVASILNVLLTQGDWGEVAFVLAYYLSSFAAGNALRSRRLLLVNARRDVERERADHARRLADVRRTERETIAREMHDVLAHRISLLSVHAGALAYRTRQFGAGSGPELSRDEIADTAQVIRDNAHQALDELHDVLRILRTDGASTSDGAPPPQPKLVDLPRLVEEAREAGQRVDFQTDLDERQLETLRSQLQRTAYRVAQEGLTNARKHAPGLGVNLRVKGDPGSHLIVEVSNPLPVLGSAPEIPGSGTGLIGLVERAKLDGGVLERLSLNGTFTLRVWLPWSVTREVNP